MKISLLPTLKDEHFASNIFQALEEENPTHLPLLLAELRRLNENKIPNYQRILDLSQKIVKLAEPSEVLQYLGARNDENQEKLLRTEYDVFYLTHRIQPFREFKKRKEAILKALEIKTNVILDAHLKQTKIKIPTTFRDGLQFKIEDTPAPLPSVPSTPTPVEKEDEGIAVEAKPDDTVKTEENIVDLPEPSSRVL